MNTTSLKLDELYFNKPLKEWIIKIYKNIGIKSNVSPLPRQDDSYYLRLGEYIKKVFDKVCDGKQLDFTNLDRQVRDIIFDKKDISFSNQSINFTYLVLIEVLCDELYELFGKIRVKRVDENAIIPTRATQGSVGYDLTAIKLHKKVSDTTYLYDTGLQIAPPQGYYTEIVPRSSLIKTGYMLANSVGIIDSDYRGNLLIALNKIDDDAPELELPFTKCQLIIRKEEVKFTFSEVDSLDNTERGDGGFGSTDSISKS